MPFAPNPVPPQFVRVVSPGTIRATSHSRPWLWLFVVVALALGAGVALLVLPLVRITIAPALEPVEVRGVVRVDLDARQVVPETGVVPGRVLGAGGTVKTVLQGVRTARLAGSVVTYDAAAADAVVAAAVAKGVGSDYVAVEPWPVPAWAEPVVGGSGRSVSLPFLVTVERYRRLTTASWRSRVAGMSVAEAQVWLAEQSGVGTVNVTIYPSFFANFSQKLPNSTSSITLVLDIRGKTSILE